MNLGELLLAVVTLIFIRNRSAATNMTVQTMPVLPRVTARAPAAVAPFAQPHASSVSSQQGKTQKTQAKTPASFNPEGLRRLRGVLRDISFHLVGLSFKADVRGNAVWIRMMEANQGTQQKVASAKVSLEILDDDVTMASDACCDRLERFLRSNGFQI
jgi:hypothetical protein